MRAGKDRGKTGEILSVDRKALRVKVKGVALVSRHQKPSQENPKGGIVRLESSIHYSNVAYFDKDAGKPSRLSVSEKEGKRFLVSKVSGKKVRDL